MLIGFLLSTLSFMPSSMFVTHNSNKLHWLFPSISYLSVRVLIWFLIVSTTLTWTCFRPAAVGLFVPCQALMVLSDLQVQGGFQREALLVG